jgi:3-phosphoshikimate 1-carboxyvinyltransferase
MTESLLKNIGVKVEFENKKIKIFNKETISNQTITIESDWSSASYFYSIAALSERSIIRLNSYKKKSLQGDDCLIEIYEKLGVSSKFEGDTLVIEKLSDFKNPKRISLNLINSPDLAQTIAVTCIGLCIDSELHGLHTLKIKETDRLSALKKELTKFGADVHTTEESIHVKSSKKLNQNIKVSTYQDHRMAMAFAPLAIKTSLMIEDASVVNKSYPDFWNDLHKIGFRYV